MKYTVQVNLEGNMSPCLRAVSYLEAHEEAQSLMEKGYAVEVVQHSNRQGIADCVCCRSHRGELISRL